MNQAPAILLSVLAIGVGGFALYKSVSNEPALGTVNANANFPAEQRLAALEGKMGDLLKRMDEMRSAPAVAGPAPARLSDEAIAAAVSKYINDHASEFKSVADSSGPAAEGGKKKSAKKSMDVSATVAKLLDPQLTYNEKKQLYDQLRKAGLLDDAISELEKKAEDARGSADAQFELGSAYIEKLQMVSDGPEKGVWAMKADSMFDKALEIDPRHWSARFSKAISLAFWPPIFGKQNDAIQQFETLRKQQEESGGTKPEFAQTYSFLGNLYQQMGKADQAQDVWKKGAQLFPNDEGLKSKLSGGK